MVRQRNVQQQNALTRADIERTATETAARLPWLSGLLLAHGLEPADGLLVKLEQVPAQEGDFYRAIWMTDALAFWGFEATVSRADGTLMEVAEFADITSVVPMESAKRGTGKSFGYLAWEVLQGARPGAAALHENHPITVADRKLASSVARERLDNWLSWWPLGLVVSILTVLVVPVVHHKGDLRITEAFHDMRSVEKALGEYRACAGALPTRDQGLGVLAAPAAGRCRVLHDDPRDPWSNPYAYDPGLRGTFGGVYSVGANGIDQHGAGDDVTTPEKTYEDPDYGLRDPLGVRLAIWGALVLGAASIIVAGLLRRRL